MCVACHFHPQLGSTGPACVSYPLDPASKSKKLLHSVYQTVNVPTNGKSTSKLNVSCSSNQILATTTVASVRGCEVLTSENSLAQQAPAVSWAVRSPSRLLIAGAKPMFNQSAGHSCLCVPSSRCFRCSGLPEASYNASVKAAAAAEPLVA